MHYFLLMIMHDDMVNDLTDYYHFFKTPEVLQQPLEYKELPFQQGLPLKEDNKSKIPNHDREIFMAILSEPKDQKDNPAALEDLDYDDFLSDAEAAETTT